MKRSKKFIPLFFILFLLSGNITLVNAQSNDIQINLGVSGCNSNSICEPDESILSCPTDCGQPPSGYLPPGTTIPPTEILSISNLSVQPNFTSAIISWDTSVSTISTIRWGGTTEVTEGTLSSVVFGRSHKMEIINLKPGTMYYFTIESRDVNGKSSVHPPIYFFTKFLVNTIFPLNPRNVKASADPSGITISWKNPPDDNFSYVRIMRHDDRFRGDPLLGKLIYEGKEEKFLDKNVVPGKKYFYALFSRDTKGNFSSGVGTSATAYSPGEIPPPIIIPPEEKPVKVLISETFFVHQYNQLVQPLIGTTSITIDNDKDIVVDTNAKTLPDDWMMVTDKNGELIGQYLFSFNKDSGRYQGVIPPLQKVGTYNVEIYRYRDDVPTIISEGSLNVKENTTPKIEKPENNNNYILQYIYDNLDWLYIVFSIIVLILVVLLLKHRRKNEQK